MLIGERYVNLQILPFLGDKTGKEIYGCCFFKIAISKLVQVGEPH